MEKLGKLKIFEKSDGESEENLLGLPGKRENAQNFTGAPQFHGVPWGSIGPQVESEILGLRGEGAIYSRITFKNTQIHVMTLMLLGEWGRKKITCQIPLKLLTGR